MALFCCICESMGKSVLNFSKDKNTGLGYCGGHQTRRTDKKFQSMQQKAIEKHKANPTKQIVKEPRFKRAGTFDESVLNSAIIPITPTPESYDGKETGRYIIDEMGVTGECGIDESLANLSSDLDYVMSLYIRYKYADAKGYVKCFTCTVSLPIKDITNGHYVKRGQRATRFLESNLRPQCKSCNNDHNYDETPYTNALEAEQPGLAAELKELGKLTYKATRDELKQALIEYRNKLEILKRKYV